MELPLSQLSEKLISFEREHHLTDNDLAFGSQLSVERIHNIKSGEATPTQEELQLLKKFMNSDSLAAYGLSRVDFKGRGLLLGVLIMANVSYR